MKWDSGLKPEIDNTYYVYQVGNDGLYHLALVEDTPWAVPEVQPLGVTVDPPPPPLVLSGHAASLTPY